MTHVIRLGPRLDQARLREVIEQAVPRPFQQHQVLWELDRHPRAAHRRGRARLTADQRSHRRAARRRGRGHRGTCLPVLRPDGAAEPPAR